MKRGRFPVEQIAAVGPRAAQKEGPALRVRNLKRTGGKVPYGRGAAVLGLTAASRQRCGGNGETVVSVQWAVFSRRETTLGV